MTMRSVIRIGVLLPLVVLTSACLVVRDEGEDGSKEVNISTPVAGLAARTGANTGDAGLPVYPGARLALDSDDGDAERANVTIGTPWFGLHVAAAKYESGDAPEQVLDFYRERMRAFGEVTECRGDVNFRDGRPVCRSQPASRDVQLLVGTEERHRVVSVKPRGGGSEFALVSIQTGTGN